MCRERPSGATLGLSWALLVSLGALLGALGALLGRSWGAFGRSWTLLERSWDALEALLGAPGALLAAPGPPLGDLGSILDPSKLDFGLNSGSILGHPHDIRMSYHECRTPAYFA